ncbi:hypothetical protein ANCDUO_04449 [Ancylostoma duodenale]|uniref:Choline/carnitine acyltransferase domain-containing protein n=1 Tax=Ancylostoma duodenale TaxID=51022 RepID=A0A0C2D6H9_9BILA|nr:hypothetical protein ANCDUO_04449 [Ancylostoma duodenale]
MVYWELSCRGEPVTAYVFTQATSSSYSCHTRKKTKKVLSYIDRNSKDDERSVACLTTQHRDKWAKNRASLIARSRTNERHIRSIEESCFCLSLIDNTYDTVPEVQM